MSKPQNTQICRDLCPFQREYFQACKFHTIFEKNETIGARNVKKDEYVNDLQK